MNDDLGTGAGPDDAALGSESSPADALSLPAFAAPPSAQRLLTLSLAVAAVMILVGFGLAWLLRGEALLSALHLPDGSGWWLVGWSLLGAALSISSTWLPTQVWPQYGAVLADTGLGVADEVLQMLGPWRMAFLVAVAGAGEEVLFRGGLQPTVGIMAAAVLFGLSHGGWRWRQFWAYTVAAAIAGAVFGWVYRLSGSLWAPILAHAAHNIAVTLYVTLWPE